MQGIWINFNEWRILTELITLFWDKYGQNQLVYFLGYKKTSFFLLKLKNNVVKLFIGSFLFNFEWYFNMGCSRFVVLKLKRNNRYSCQLFLIIYYDRPSENGRIGPSFCNKSLPFDFSKLKPIEAELLKYWPNLYTDTAMDSFWEHEWY